MRTITKLVTIGAAALALAAGGALGITTANAEEAPVDPTVAKLTARLDRFDVPSATQAALVAKLLRGEPLDADRGAEPVSATTRTEGGQSITRYVYADGSVAEAKATLAISGAPGPHPTAIAGCRHTQSAGSHKYSGCKVTWDAATWSGGFVATYGHYQFGSHVDSVSGSWFEGAGDISAATNSIPVPTCNSSCVSWGQASAVQKLTVAGVGVTRTIGIKISVNNSDKKGGKSSSFG